MSKAFTREDDVSDIPVLPPLASPLPPGAKNFLTPGGVERLRQELTGLVDGERPRLLSASAGDPEAKRELAKLDQRIRYLQQSLASAEVVALNGESEQVRFGSTVTVRDSKGNESTYRIVGVDEADFSRNEVSWLSPIARALMNAKLGQKVPFKFPFGAAELEIVRIG
ncbi:MAG: transcription elongation factor GreB [Verrucomicrobia bacterium]|nr:transcription elongation factor GreB [Verrucomicrobiota bacterium]